MSMGHENRSQDEQPQARPADWDSLKEEVGDAADAAVERGRSFLDAAREQATVYVDARKDAVAQSVADFATSLRTSTASFEDRPNIRAVADSAAEGLDQLADSIRQRSFAEIFSEGERLVRTGQVRSPPSPSCSASSRRASSRLLPIPSAMSIA